METSSLVCRVCSLLERVKHFFFFSFFCLKHNSGGALKEERVNFTTKGVV